MAHPSFGLSSQLANLLFGEPSLSPTKSSMAFADTAMAAELLEPSLVHLEASDDANLTSPRMFLFHDGTGAIDHLRNLEGFLGFPCTIIPLTSRAPLDSLKAMADHYVSAILAYQPTGPYVLAGYSFGARTAFQAAKLLEAKGHVVQGLLCIDDPPFYDPAYTQASRRDICRAAACLAFAVDGSEGQAAVDLLLANKATPDALCQLVKDAASPKALSPLLQGVATMDPSIRLATTQAFVTGTCRIVVMMANAAFLKDADATPAKAHGALLRVAEAKRQQFRAHIPLTLQASPDDYGMGGYVRNVELPIRALDESHEALFSIRSIVKTAKAMNELYSTFL